MFALFFFHNFPLLLKNNHEKKRVELTSICIPAANDQNRALGVYGVFPVGNCGMLREYFQP